MSDTKSETNSVEYSDKVKTMANNIITVAEECIMPEEVLQLVKYHDDNNWENPILCYDGFEPSGLMHIAQGFMKAIIVNQLTQNGCYYKIWVADMFAQMNLKLGGDMKKIRKAGELMIRIWELCGMDMSKVEFIWSSEEIEKNSHQYYTKLHDIALNTSMDRLLNCTPALGRSESDKLQSSQMLYPLMQCTDIFHLKVNICQLGLDQRKVNMLARDYCSAKKIKRKPIILSHHMLMGLDGSTKMSKSNPDNSIFMTDTVADVKRKIKKSFCEPGNVTQNPILEYFRYIIMPRNPICHLERNEKYGGNLEFKDYQSLVDAFQKEEIHPQDLKGMAVKYINTMLTPIQKELETNKELKELVKLVTKYRNSSK